ncbi:MAG: DUF4404 family protein [Pirellulaceae bacterium]
MAERLERLKQLLTELEAELAKSPVLDAATQANLQKLRGEIDEAIAQAQPEALGESGLAKQLQSQMEAFEAAHPSLTNLISQVTNALGQLGI